MATTDLRTARPTNGPTHASRQANVVVDLRRKPPVLRYVKLLACALVLGIIVEGLIVRLPADSPFPPPGERIGTIHVHTKASDGSGTIPGIIAGARKANLSFVAITDHNRSVPVASGAQVPPDFAMISGEELSTASGHFLALGIPPGWQHPDSQDANTLMAAAHAAGAFNVVAHPFSANIPWKDWQTLNFDAIEVWNDDETWRRNNPLDFSISMLLYGVNDELALVRLARTPVRNFAKWDELLVQRPVVGMCGSDAHAAIRVGHGIIVPFPGYLPVFRIARTHALIPAAASGNPVQNDSVEILNAIKAGRSFCAVDALFPSNGFTMDVSSGGVSAGPGDSLEWKDEGRIHVQVPSGSSEPLIKIIHDGREIASKQAWALDEPIADPGTYRTEVFLRQPGLSGWRRWTLWIFSNPVYVTPSHAALETSTANSVRSRQHFTSRKPAKTPS